MIHPSAPLNVNHTNAPSNENNTNAPLNVTDPINPLNVSHQQLQQPARRSRRIQEQTLPKTML